MKFIILLLFISSNSLSQNQIEFNNNLSIVDTSLSLEGEHEYKMLTVIGNISNKSNEGYQNIVLEAKFYNKDGILIDAITDKLYENIFPANDKATFRIQGGAAKTPKQYFSHKIRILSADIIKPCKSKTGVRKFMSDWGGFIIFISFMMFLIYSSVKYQKEEKKTKQKLMDTADNQSKQFEKMTQILESIAQKMDK